MDVDYERLMQIGDRLEQIERQLSKLRKQAELDRSSAASDARSSDGLIADEETEEIARISQRAVAYLQSICGMCASCEGNLAETLEKIVIPN